jgi:MFS superfamily sulfate permease-like transporter
VIEFLWDGWRPHHTVLGRVDGLRGFHDVTRYPEARRVPGLVLFRWDAPLFFANAELFHQRVLESVASSPTPVKRVIVTAEPVTSIDVTSADVLVELDEALRAMSIELHFAEMKSPVREKLTRFELDSRFGAQCHHDTVGASVDAYLEDHKVEWKKDVWPGRA